MGILGGTYDRYIEISLCVARLDLSNPGLGSANIDEVALWIRNYPLRRHRDELSLRRRAVKIDDV